MEESISQAAGSEHGDNLAADEIERLIREVGRVPYERTTTYGRIEGRPRRAATERSLLPQTGLHVALSSGY
jgi:FO synthase